MAHPIKASPYPKLKAACDELDNTLLVLVKDEGGVYVVEEINSGREMAEMIFLAINWAIDETRQRYGEEKVVEFCDAILSGILTNVPDYELGMVECGEHRVSWGTKSSVN